MNLTFYTTLGCHLCSQALEVVNSVLTHPEIAPEIQLQMVDIASHDDLIRTYCERIPVIAVGSAEIDWPFDQQKFVRWLTDNVERELDDY